MATFWTYFGNFYDRLWANVHSWFKILPNTVNPPQKWPLWWNFVKIWSHCDTLPAWLPNRQNYLLLVSSTLMFKTKLYTSVTNYALMKVAILGQEPWSSGYGKRLMFWRLWVQIPAPYTGWKWHFAHWFVVKNCIVCLKRPKINEKEAGVGLFIKKSCNICLFLWTNNCDRS